MTDRGQQRLAMRGAQRLRQQLAQQQGEARAQQNNAACPQQTQRSAARTHLLKQQQHQQHGNGKARDNMRDGHAHAQFEGVVGHCQEAQRAGVAFVGALAHGRARGALQCRVHQTDSGMQTQRQRQQEEDEAVIHGSPLTQ